MKNPFTWARKAAKNQISNFIIIQNKFETVTNAVDEQSIAEIWTE